MLCHNISLRLCHYITLWLYLISLTYGFIKTIPSSELTRVLIQKDPALIFFFDKYADLPLEFLNDYESAANYLAPYNVTLIKVSCEYRDEKRCRPRLVNNILYGFKEGEEKMALALESIYDEDAIIAAAFHLLVSDQVPMINTIEDKMRIEQICLQHHCDVLFAFITGLGTREHRVVLEMAYKHRNIQRFAITTSVDMIPASSDCNGKSNTENEPRLWILQCSNQPDHCIHAHLHPAFSLPKFNALINLLQLKPWVDAPPRHSDLLTLLPSTLPAVIMFYSKTTNTEEQVKDIAGKLGTIFRATVGFLTVNIEEATDSSLQKLGLTRVAVRPPAICVKAKPNDKISLMNEFDDPYGFVIEQLLEIKDSSEDDDEDFTFPPLDELKEDDEVSLWIKEKRKEEGQSPFSFHPEFPGIIPVITSNEFKNIQQQSLTVVVFYLPWDAVSEMFLRTVSQVAEKLKSFKLATTCLSILPAAKITRLDCFDWSNLCDDIGIETFPAFSVISNGQNITYQDVIDENEIFNIFVLNQFPAELKNEKEVECFLSGTGLPAQVADTATVAFIPPEKDWVVLKQELLKLRGRHLIATANTTLSCCGNREEQGIYIAVKKFHGQHQSEIQCSGPVNVKELAETVRKLATPIFPELSIQQLPEISGNIPFAILFVSKNSKTITNLMESLAVAYPSVRFTWILKETEISQELLKVYLSNPSDRSSGKDILCVIQHKKSEVCCYRQSKWDKSSVSKWIDAVLTDKETQCGKLLSSQWLPGQKGFDYLQLIEKDQLGANYIAPTGKRMQWQEDNQDVHSEL